MIDLYFPKKSEPAERSRLVHSSTPIVSKVDHFASPFDQFEANSFTRAGVYVRPHEPKSPYLTNTDKSPPTPVKNDYDFQEKSFKLYLKTMDLYRTDKKSLQFLFLRGISKIRFINKDHIVLYSPQNPKGNSNAGWSLAKDESNTDKARLSSKQHALEKALANVDLWEYFATFTLDKTKQNRFDFEKCFPHVVKFLQRRGIKYFIVPERHKNGAWHFHALLSAEMRPYLAEFEGKALNNPYIAHSLASGKPIRHCRAYSERFGYNIIEPCRNKEACVFYMTKYVLKTFDDPNFERVSRRRYFTSKGLLTPYVISPNKIDLENFQPSNLSRRTEKVYLKRFSSPHRPSLPVYDSLSPPPFP